MPHVLVRNLPEDIHQALVERAQAAGTSLQRYLSAELTRLANTPSLDDIIARIERRAGGAVGLEQAVTDLDEIRSER